MLNEFLEFQAYVTNPESNNPRIQPLLFTESFSDSASLIGLEEILTIIARGFVFSCYEKRNIYTKDGLLNEEVVKNTICVLQSWCGFAEEICHNTFVDKWFEKYPEAKGWLKLYWSYHFEHNKNKTKKSKEELWSSVIKKWNSSLTSEYDFRSKSITYKNVIANALEMGPLKERYLVFKKDINSKEKNPKKQFDYLYSDCEGNPQYTTKMKLLKNIAAYLILLERQPNEQKEVLLPRARLLDWYGIDDTKNDTSIWYLKDFLWEQKPIFFRNEPTSYIKFWVESNYIINFDFKLIENSEITKYKELKDYWILEDLGTGLNGCWHIK